MTVADLAAPPRLVTGYADVEDTDAFVDDLAGIGAAHDSVVQAFDAGLVAGERHLERAWACARRAIDRDVAIARNPAVEVLCYAAGRRQIDDALEMGVEAGRGPIVVLVASGDQDAAAAAVRDLIDPADLESGADLGAPDRLCEYFGIGDAEVAATDADLETLVCERVALLSVER